MNRWMPKQAVPWAWLIGQVAQGLAIGPLLFFAFLGLLALAENVRAFTYQGY